MAGAMLAASTASRRLDLGGADGSTEACWTGFEGKLVVDEVGASLAMPKSRLAVDTYVEQVGYHVSAFDPFVTRVIS